MRFSQRIGLRPVKTTLQVDSMDEELKIRLWNLLLEYFFYQISDRDEFGHETKRALACKYLWKEFFNNPIDTIPMYFNKNAVSTELFIDHLRKWYFSAAWHDIYDFLEYIVVLDNQMKLGFARLCNSALETEVSGYRIVNDRVVQITSEDEINEIEDALKDDKLRTVKTHLERSLDLLADKKNPDYRNSIKESISAVEALCKNIVGEDSDTLGKALHVIEKKHGLHKSLKKGFSSIYGYTSDAAGIRHGLVESDIPVTFAEAKFMLVSCSAFINYLRTTIGI